MGQGTGKGLPEVQVLDLAFSREFKLQDAIVRKQAEYSDIARTIYLRPGTLDRALPYLQDFQHMPLQQQR